MRPPKKLIEWATQYQGEIVRLLEEIELGAYYLLGYNGPTIDRFSDRSAPATVDPKCVQPVQLRMIPATETVGGLQ